MDVRIMHLSDIHIGDTFMDCSSIAEKIMSALSLNDKNNINYVIVTGDIFDYKKDNTNDKKIDIAINFFDKLCCRLKLSKENFLFVPGNHDLCLDDNDPWVLYKEFISRFYGGLWQKIYELETQYVTIKLDENNKILYLGLNTNAIKDKRAYECVKEEQLAYIENQLSIIETQLSKNSDLLTDYYKIAFFHHPFYIFSEPGENELRGTICNATLVEKRLAQWGINLVLHGHKHIDSTGIRRLRGALVYTASAGSMKSNVQSPAFNIIEVKEAEERGQHKFTKLYKMQMEDADGFKLKEIVCKDPLNERYLLEMLETKKECPHENECRTIIEMMDKLYASYDSVNVLHNTYFRHFLLFSIRYRMQVRQYSCPNNEDVLKEMSDQFRADNTGFPEVILHDVLIELGNWNVKITEEERKKQEKDQIRKIYFSIAIVANFFTDLYLDFTKYWMDNVREIIGDSSDLEKYKKIKFYESGIKYDNLFRYIFVQIKCENIKTKKCVIELVNKFRKRFHAEEDYFYCIKLNVKDIIPEIVSNEDDMFYYEYEASVRRLIPLLTGKNIYSSKLVFTRELIQNAIDAVSFRERRNSNGKFRKEIEITIRQDRLDRQDGHYFKIRDYGIGMKKEIIERYFATLGRSYYKEYDFVTDQNLDYNPISNFGIGFLSVFRPCKRVEITTKPFDEDVCYNVTIEGNKEYFYVYPKTPESFDDAGTEIICHFREGAEEEEETIFKYIKNIMVDIKYNINILMSTKKETIRSKAIRKSGEKARLFIPFDEKEKKPVLIDNYAEVLESSYIDKYEYGMLIQETRQNNNDDTGTVLILNAGVLLGRTNLEDILPPGKRVDIDLKYNRIVMDFPPNWLSIDVSREKAEKFNSEYIKEETFWRNLCKSFQSQFDAYVENNKDTSLAEVSEIATLMEKLCLFGIDHYIPIAKVIILNTKFKEDSIIFSISEKKADSNDQTKFEIRYNYDKECEDSARKIHNSLYMLLSEIDTKDFSEISKVLDDSRNYYPVERFLGRIGLGLSQKMEYFPIALAACLPADKKKVEYNDIENKVFTLVQQFTMEKSVVSDLGKEELFSVDYDDKMSARMEVKSDDLTKIVANVAELYGAYNGINKYDFIWDYIIHKSYLKYFIESENWQRIRTIGQERYEYFRETIKDLYASNKDSKIDIYMIASCYMGSLLELSVADFENDKEEGSDGLDKYRWILDSGEALVFMWMLSVYKETDDKKFNILYLQKQLKWPQNEEKYEKYVKLLALKDTYHEKLDILCFSELLYWLEIYNEDKINKEIAHV